MRVDGEREGIEGLRAFALARFGLQLEDTKLAFLGEVLRERITRTKSRDVSTYLSLLVGRDARSAAEARAIAERLTVGETYFFRYADQWRALTEHALPARLRARQEVRELRVLSAGSSSGEEAYTLAMSIREALPEVATWRVAITGIDINPAALEKARRGRYSAWSLRETSLEARARYFHARGNELELDERVRSMVRFEERNLVEDDPRFWHPESFDIVFCRNVTMYFSPDVMRAVMRRIARAMAPGGFLFLGHAETLRAVSNDFHLRNTHEVFYYERRDAIGGDDAAMPGRDATHEHVEPLIDPDDASWVETIRGATERIARLSVPEQPSAPRATHVRRAPDLAKALEMLRNERFEDALGELADLSAEGRADPDALLLRAVLLTNGGRVPEAEVAAKELLLADELSAGAHYVMALCREHAGDLSAAEEHDRAAIHLDDGFAMPHLHLGLLSKRRGDHVRARSEIERASLRLAREDASRILLFAGGFSREALVALCRAELGSREGAP